MANEKFKCQRGVLISPDMSNNGAMVPLFLKTRSKDMYINTKTIDIFAVEEYADRAILRGNLPLSNTTYFSDTYSKNNTGTILHSVFFPYEFKNDSFFNFEFSLRTESYNERWSETIVNYFPIFSNNSHDRICGVHFTEHAITGSPTATNASITFMVTGNKSQNLYYTVSGLAFNVGTSNVRYIFYPDYNDNIDFFFINTNSSNITCSTWNCTKSKYAGINISSGAKINLVFYYDEKNNKMLFKPVSP